MEPAERSQPDVPARRPQLAALTSLRFFAAATVVVNHYGVDTLDLRTPMLRGWAQSGYEAVTFFFVLSGFILTYAHLRDDRETGINVTARQFWVARAGRIMPAYLLALLIAAPAFVYALMVSKMVSPAVFAPALLLVPTLLQAWVPPVAFAWNGPAWSLSVEAFFYALFPALARGLRGRGIWTILGAVYVGVVLVVLVRLAFPLGPFGTSWFNFWAYFPLLHLPQFLFGMVLCRVSLAVGPAWSRYRLYAFLLGAAGLALVLGLRDLPLWLRSDAVLAPLYGLVIVGAIDTRPLILRWLAWPVMIFLGEVSYSIYILHIPLALWWGKLLDLLNLRLPPVIDFGLYAAAVVLASALCFRFLETPARRWINRQSWASGKGAATA
jgi:peptidoglycan/LPS O-acetylase OafA/YrhL